MDDAVLLGRYVETGCQASFQEIVTRHSGWVFSLSLRAVRDRHLAEDVTQAVFIILAKKASGIREGTPLSGWLFKAARFAVSDALKRRTRMRNRENRFAEFFRAANGDDGATALGDPNASEVSDELSHTLDEALACLSDGDRQAVLLRFYEGKSLAEVGQVLEISEEAAKKRVSRAVDKLRKQFANKGVITGVSFILLLLARRSAEAATFAPAVVAPAAAAPFTHAIAGGALKLMAQAQAKLLGAIFAGGMATVVAVPATVVSVLGPSTAPASVAQVAPALPPTPYVSKPAETPRLPNDSRVADLWIGYKNDILWRSDAHTSASSTPSLASGQALPFYLKSAEKKDAPYAVAVDSYGNFFMRPLDRSILSSPSIRQSQFDYDAGPSDNDRRVHQMMRVIEPTAAESRLAQGGADATASFRPVDGGGGKLSDKEWQKLHRVQENEDGTVVVEQLAPMRMMMPGDLLYQQTGPVPLEYQVQVPEPTVFGLLAVAGAALMTRRRRRRPE
jgi:RNA polymerase sigma factor (sigma-70 family)